MKSALSPREFAVMDYAVQGCTDDQIARALGIERGTVKIYWVRIRGKLGNLSRAGLVARFVQHDAEIRYAQTVAEKEAEMATKSVELELRISEANAEIERLKQLLQKTVNLI